MDTHSIDTVNPETTGGIHQISRNKLEFHQISEKYCWMIDNNSRISEEAMEFLFRNKLLILYCDLPWFGEDSEGFIPFSIATGIIEEVRHSVLRTLAHASPD